MSSEPIHNEFTTADAIKIHFMTLGEGVPVILIHGYTANAEDKWFKTGVAQELARTNRVIAIDARGHGRSEKPHDPGQYGPQMAEDVIELMDHLDIEKAHIHGFSMGGGITTQLLARHQHRIITASYGGSGVRETDPEWLAQVPEDEERDNSREQAARDALQASVYRDNEALQAVRAYPWQEGEQGRIDLTQITVPVLSINGSLDKPNAKTHRMARELANFHCYVLPERGHLTSVEQGSPYTALLVDFITLYNP
ncbi:MAG: alpha/beta hydrolase [Pseudomonadales bacterium]|jgi:pimeloyl-ACP methyl ester carboxylesterase|nr:alpha/beta hydrolase [Pseudomonadales bacterium]MDP7594531.1 alpha/beta hydrolase [Pseudomonadales bacterium]HJN50733.1 alpha/beta hydrolase [Pseudomonadales bacterium]|tara:strand:- start:11004 stop:11765 length:762 start_codon:yes stop_codon:yes gene_type:complete